MGGDLNQNIPWKMVAGEPHKLKEYKYVLRFIEFLLSSRCCVKHPTLIIHLIMLNNYNTDDEMEELRV